MPRYFFHVEDGSSFPDLQGTELPSLTAARKEALRFAAALLADRSEQFWHTGEWAMRVTDESDLTLFHLMFHVIEAPSTMGL